MLKTKCGMWQIRPQVKRCWDDKPNQCRKG